MLVSFSKLSKEPKKFFIELDGCKMCALLSRQDGSFILFKGSVSGSIDTICDRCGENFQHFVEEETIFLLHKGIYKNGADKTKYDVIEIESDFIDLNELFLSELESIKSDYKYCSVCKGD